MKRLICAALVLALILPVGPVLAGDTFHALTLLPTTAQASLTPMDEAQLATIQGRQVRVGVTQEHTHIANVIIIQNNALNGSIAGGGKLAAQQGNSANVNISQLSSSTATVRQVL
jgi:hypothetical protein